MKRFAVEAKGAKSIRHNPCFQPSLTFHYNVINPLLASRFSPLASRPEAGADCGNFPEGNSHAPTLHVSWLVGVLLFVRFFFFFLVMCVLFSCIYIFSPQYIYCYLGIVVSN